MTKKTDGTTLPKPLELRPSAAKRWTRCPAFPVLDRWNAGERTESPWLLEGTYAHKLAEICLRNEELPGEYIREEIPCVVDEGTPYERTEIFVPNEEMVAGVSVYLNVCSDVSRYRKRTDQIGVDKVEDKVGATFGGLRIEGTADFLSLSPKRIIVVDFKYGQNVEVEAEENDQLSAYLLGAVNKYGPELLEELVGIIVQPRLRTGGPIIKKWEIPNPKTWVKDETKRFDAAVKAIVGQGNDLTFNPSPSACQWCDSLKYCRGLGRIVKMLIEKLDTEVPDLDSDFIREVLAVAKPLRDFIWEVERHSTTRALNGEEFDGFKLVEGGRVSPRVWNNLGRLSKLLDKKIEEGAVAEDKIYKSREPITPAQMEKVLGKEFVEKHSTRPSSDRPTILVPESDKRKPIKRANDEFADFLEDDDDDDLDEFEI